MNIQYTWIPIKNREKWFVRFDPQRAYQRINLHVSRIKKGWTFADNRYSL